MIILINTKTNERKALTVRQLFDMMADPAIAKRMCEVQNPTVHGKPVDVLVYTYTPEDVPGSMAERVIAALAPSLGQPARIG